MIKEAAGHLELINIVSFFAEKFQGSPLGNFLHLWENIIFSLLIAVILLLVGFIVSKKSKIIPLSRLQNLVELIVSGIDDFICGILGPRGRKFTPFIGTLFIYILFMNILGVVPLMKSSTTSWSVTLALALCVFVYVQFTAIKELGFIGYLDHLMGNPRGLLAVSIVFPLAMFFLHIISELIRPITLSLRLRSNIWGDDMLLAVLANFGIKGVPLFVFSSLLVIVGAVVQAVVFSLLTTIYFVFVLKHEEKEG